MFNKVKWSIISSLGAALAFAKKSQAERANTPERTRNARKGSRKAQVRAINPLVAQEVKFKASLTRS